MQQMPVAPSPFVPTRFEGFNSLFASADQKHLLRRHAQRTEQLPVLQRQRVDRVEVPSKAMNGRIAWNGTYLDPERLFFALRTATTTGDRVSLRYPHTRPDGMMDRRSEWSVPRLQAYALERLTRKDYAEKYKRQHPKERVVMYTPQEYPPGQKVFQTEDGRVTLERRASDGGSIEYRNGVLNIPVRGTETISIVYDGVEHGQPTETSYHPKTNIIRLSKTLVEKYQEYTSNPDGRRLETDIRDWAQESVRHELNHLQFARLSDADQDVIIAIFARHAQRKGAAIHEFFSALYEAPGTISERYTQVAESTVKALRSEQRPTKLVYLTDAKTGRKRELALHSVVDELMAYASWRDISSTHPYTIRARPGKTLTDEDLLRKRILETAGRAYAELTQAERDEIARLMYGTADEQRASVVKAYMEPAMLAVDILAKEL